MDAMTDALRRLGEANTVLSKVVALEMVVRALVEAERHKSRREPRKDAE